MPSINLRLTEEQHLALKDWALGAHRSIQREAIFRIFDGRLSEREHSEPINQERESRDPDRTPGEAHGANVLSRPRSESRPGGCGMNTAAGTKCKVCGKVHPL